MTRTPLLFLLAVLIVGSTIGAARADPPAWADRSLSADERARRLLDAMTFDEKIGLLHTRFGVPMGGHGKPEGALDSAGFNPGVPRLGVQPIQETDAGLGVANPVFRPFDATALPSGLALGASFDPQLAQEAGAMIGAEARAMGFNVLLAGGANLTRDPRGGRNFEYIGEDPLLTGLMAGGAVAGVQSRGIVSTLKHFILNAQENGRMLLSAKLAEPAARESDLLAFELAIERGQPGAIMVAYNRINGAYASENRHLIADVLKGDWRYPGWVMSDWSSTHSAVESALAGLDQQSGIDNDPQIFFGGPLKAAVEAGKVPMTRVDDMVHRILRSYFAVGVMDRPPRPGKVMTFDEDAQVAQRVAERGIVLLKNADRLLPLPRTTRSVLVVGGNADKGVLSGGGSSQVYPEGALRYDGEPLGKFPNKSKVYDPSPPLDALRHEMPGTTFTFADGLDVARTVRAAREADTVVVVAEKWSSESRDVPDLALPGAQDALIKAVAAANPRTIVVLETGGPATMPWLASVGAVVEAWFPGERGGQAIAGVLSGRVNPSGRLPMTFPAGEDQLPRPALSDPDKTTSIPGIPLLGGLFDVDYDIEGADVGYKWFLRTKRAPLFPFGYGLSYTRFEASNLRVEQSEGLLTASLDVTNRGERDGIDVPQVYLEGAQLSRRLVGFESVALAPGQTKHVTVTVDPRLAARYDDETSQWRIAAGSYRVSARPNALDEGLSAEIALREEAWSARQKAPCGTSGGGRLCVGSR